MNGWQVCRQLAYLLEQATWPDGAAERVFSQVLVSPGPAFAPRAALRFPFAVLAPGEAAVDPQEPLLVTQAVEATLVQRVAGDGWGESVMVGGARSGGQGRSGGRGLLELEEELLAAVAKLQQQHGIALKHTWTSAAGAEPEGEHGGVLASRAYRFSAWCAGERSYAAPSRLAATTPGGGAVSLTWTLPPARYDRREVVLRRAAGATPPASPTAGTGVTLSGLLATSVVDTPGAGQHSYALFGGYDELGAAASDRFSAGATKTVTAV